MVALPPANTVESLYHAHHNWLTGWLRRRLGCPDSAADLAQDTFVRVLCTGPYVVPREPRAFLATVARRLIIDNSRRKRLEKAYLDALAQLPEACAPSPEQRWLLLETLQALDELLDGLPRAVRPHSVPGAG